MQSRPSRWPWLLAIPVVIGAGWWLFRGTVEAPNAASTPKPTAVAAAAPTPPTLAAPSAPQHPLPAHPADAADAADAAIPPLAKSDSAAWEALRALVPDEAALAIVLRDHLIQRAVVMIDNLTQPSMSRRASVLQPVPGELQVAEADGRSVIDTTNATRYAPYVAAFTALDAQALVATYVRFYPLIQQAYAELGAPDRYFNDRLIAVIDHLLLTPEAAQPIVVLKDERGRYRYANPALESLSVGQKALLRLGPTQAAAVKAQLQRIRAAVLRGR